ncbi:MAG: rhodanese-like domain-containing protein, partial [Bacteroidia bacterium]|nr:rhodanese-like domain-containing protein [Bacteroidia bacterium]
PKETYDICNEEAILVDVREDFMIGCKKFDVKQTIYCPASKIEELYINLPKDKPLVIADATSIHSKETIIFLTEKGFTNIANLAGGLVEWERDNLPLHSDITEMLTGSCMCQLRQRHKKT